MKLLDKITSKKARVGVIGLDNQSCSRSHIGGIGVGGE